MFLNVGLVMSQRRFIYDIETLSVSLALCEGNPFVTKVTPRSSAKNGACVNAEINFIVHCLKLAQFAMAETCENRFCLVNGC